MPKFFRARETEREDALDGLPLASFGRRAAAFGIDFVLVSLLRKPVQWLWENQVPHQWERHTLIILPHVVDLLVLVAYFWLALYLGRGQTVGKRLLRIRVVSLSHESVTLWQALERALGYGASFLECGLGFAQYFLQRNQQCAHDRLAETIVIDAGRKLAPPDPPLAKPV